MPHDPQADIKKFHFPHLHPQVSIGTASDRYAGWLRQIYTEERYQGRIGQRPKVIGEQTFTEEVLPVYSVKFLRLLMQKENLADIMEKVG